MYMPNRRWQRPTVLAALAGALVPLVLTRFVAATVFDTPCWSDSDCVKALGANFWCDPSVTGFPAEPGAAGFSGCMGDPKAGVCVCE
jgi:hypothetical protein